MTKNQENTADWKPDYLPLLVTVINELKRAPRASIRRSSSSSFFLPLSFFFSANTFSKSLSEILSPSIREKEADCVDFRDYKDARRRGSAERDVREKFYRVTIVTLRTAAP